MKIKGTSIIEIEINKDEERRITIKHLKDLVGWQDTHWVDMKTNKLMKHTAYHGAHSWSEDITLRDASAVEIAVQKIISIILMQV